MEREATYTVYVDDNFHFADESERRFVGDFADCESAVACCTRIVESSLRELYHDGMTAAELLNDYKLYGDDPWVSSPDRNCTFSAWTHAGKHCAEICG